MIIVSDKEICGVCKKKEAVVLCDGCGIPICKDCRFFDLWSYGCGHIDTKVFCSKCFDDIEINPWGGRRD